MINKKNWFSTLASLAKNVFLTSGYATWFTAGDAIREPQNA